jgi:cytochrome b561
MSLRNTPDSFGLVSRALHWTMALLVIAMLALGLRIEGMEPGLSNLWLYGLHKGIGIILLALVVLRLIWHRLSPPPAPLGPPDAWPQRSGRNRAVAWP